MCSSSDSNTVSDNTRQSPVLRLTHFCDRDACCSDYGDTEWTIKRGKQ